MKTTTQPQPVVAFIRKLVVPLFLVSGATGLIYEVTWMRLLGGVFGNTVFAASTVLTAFMLGLAVGSWFFGRWVDRAERPLRFYAVLEVAIGLYALAFPLILGLTDRFYSWFYQTYEPDFYLLNLVRFGVSVAILLLPAAFMGGTLPVLSALWAIPTAREEQEAETGQSVGILYAVNSFGAVAGSFLAGYFLIRLWGVSGSIYAAAAANAIVGVAALLLSLSVRPRQVVRQAAQRKRLARESAAARLEKTSAPLFVHSTGRRLAVLVGVFLAGFCALALEVLWTRVLVFVLETSAYAFACMLTCFILGLAVGSLICSVLIVPRLRNPIFALGVVEFFVGLSVAASIFLLSRLWHIDLFVVEQLIGAELSFSTDMAAHFIDVLVIMFVPTVLMGAAFPIAVKACAPAWQVVGQRVGQVYASNTIGCVLGSFAAGFLLIPRLGLRDSFLGVIAILFLIAVFLFLLAGRRRMVWALPALLIGGALVAGAFYLVPRDVFLRTMNTYHYPSEIVFLDDGVTGIVTVHDLPDGDRLIAVDGVDVAGMDLMLRTTQKLQAYAPLVVHESPQDVVQIGYGSGETCGIGLDFGVARYSIVDICPGVFKAGTFFDEINRRSYANPDLRKIIMDGKNFVKLSDETFDIIMNDSTYPGTTGSSALYTYDHFQACRDHLKAGGVLSCWVPLDLRLQDFQMVVRSFQAAMPHSSLWMANNCLNKHAVLLGTLEPMQLDFRRIKKVVEQPDIAADLEEIGVHSVYDFLDCLVLDEEGLRQLAADGPLHTDDKPSLEFGAAIKRDVEDAWLAVIRAIHEHYSPALPHVTNAGPFPGQEAEPRAVLQQYARGTRFTLAGAVGMLQGDPDVTNDAFAKARQANPHDRDVDYILDEMKREIEALTEAIQRSPQAPALRARLAKRYMLLRQFAPAAQQYQHFLVLEGGHAGAWNNLGMCYERLEQFDRAADAFERAIQWDPGLFVAYAHLAKVHELRGDTDEAIAVLQRVLPLSSRVRQAFVYDAIARLHFLRKQYHLAITCLDKAIERAAGDPQAQQEFIVKRQRVVEASQSVTR